MKKLALVAIFSTITLLVIAEDLYYLNESFENSSRTSWIADPFISSKQWKFTFGGQYIQGGDPYNPEIPISGNYNAGIYSFTSTEDSVKFITPMLQLGGSGKPTLRFYHCQYGDPWIGVDKLNLYFRSSPSAQWDLIESWTNYINFWDDEIFDIEAKGTKYLTDSFQIAFEGVVADGFGVYLDSVTVKEDDVVPVFVKSITYSSIPYEAIPAGATDIPLNKFVIRMLGNSGERKLDSLTVIPAGSALSHIEADSFKLFLTRNNVFAPIVADTSTIISTASLSGGMVTFSDIDQDLFLGNNYLWVSATFANDIEQEVSLSFSVPEEGININDTLLPVSNRNISGTHIIYESIFYDNFESGDGNWTVDDPNFEVGQPNGSSIGTLENPETPFNGLNIMATNLNGGYLPNIDSSTAYYIYTPVFDLTYYINTAFYMHSYMIIDGSDDAVIDLSTDGGSTWNNVWTSNATTNNTYWTEFYDENMLAQANRQSQVQLRIGIYQTGNDPWPGLNIDNFALLSEKLGTDVGITEVLSPYDDCIDCNNDTVKIRVRNYADGPSPGVIPVFYGIKGIDSTLVYDTIYGSIGKDSDTIFSFSTNAYFPKADFYSDFIVGISLNSDQDPTNDTLTIPLTIQKNVSPPHFENYEYNGGIWFESEGSRWTCMDMSGTITTDPLSPNIWVLSPYGNYSNNDTAWVTSGCYNLSATTRNIIQLKYWADAETNKDGARVEYSINNGNTWSILEDPVHNTYWNWFSNPVDALGSNGWSGTVEWTTAKAMIPVDAESNDKVKFRIMFMSDDANAQSQGFAFNDLEIYQAPHDIGISYISIPKDTCQFSYPDVMQLWVKNYGYNSLLTNDSIIIGYDFENEASVIDTFILSSDVAPGDSTSINVPTVFTATEPGTYNIKAYTLIEDDPFFYGSNNDTATKTFEIWQNPIIYLEDTISSRQPDTLMLEPNPTPVPEYSYLWDDLSTGTTYDVDEPGTYYLTVTESVHGCKTFDSAYVELLFNDVGIDSIIWPQSSCELSSAENVQVQIRNLGTDSLIISDKIVLYYQFDGAPPVKDSVILDEALYEGAAYWFTFNNATIDVSAETSYAIKAFTDYGGDTIPENDTIESSFTVFGYPDLDLGNDTTIEALSYNLYVDPTHDSYLWMDGDTTVGTRTIDSSGYYKLNIVDVNGCPATDSIDIWFKIRDVGPVALISPVSECNRFGTDAVTVQIENAGSDTIQTTDNINVSYRINAGAPVNEVLNGITILPGASYNYTFSGDIDITTFDDYDFNMTASTAGDLRNSNDTLNKVIETNATPDASLPFVDNQVYYEADKELSASSGTNYTYLWEIDYPDLTTYSTEQMITATDRGTITLTITDTVTGCYATDSKYLYLNILDYLISSVGIDETTCSGEKEDVAVSILNNGNLPRPSAEISLDYYINDVFQFTENFTKNNQWPKGETEMHTTQNTILLEGESTANLRIEITADGDLNTGNDIFARTYTLLQSPDVDLGPDNQVVSFPFTIDAGSGHASYLWSNGTTGSTLTVTTTGTYSVDVEGTNGCITSRTVYLTDRTLLNEMDNQGLEISLFPNPASEYVTLEISFDDPGRYIMEILNSQDGTILMHEITAQEYQEELYIGNLPAGLYFIRIRNKDMYYVRKMIIQ